jgi:ribosomal-protein-alanine N-acetyltransferase
MLIREWKFEDILALSKLEKECFSTDCWSYATFASCYENPAFHAVVAEEGGEVIGYGGITVAVDSADIENVLVAEAYRRGGVGGKLLEKLIEIAKGCGVEKVFLEVRVSNTPALKLYLKGGFNGVYARTRYYSNGEDCLVMSKQL